MFKRRRSFAALVVCFIIIQLAVLAGPAPVEASKAMRFEVTSVYNDYDGYLTVTGRFHNTGSEYISYVDNFYLSVYLDGYLRGADYFAFTVDTPPGYYREVYMKFNVRNAGFNKWYVKWDAFNIY